MVVVSLTTAVAEAASSQRVGVGEEGIGSAGQPGLGSGSGRMSLDMRLGEAGDTSEDEDVAETPNPGAHFGGQLPFSVGRDRGKVPLCIYA